MGGKKRKAAQRKKKKKQKESSSTNTQQGNGDVGYQDTKVDGGELGSYASREHSGDLHSFNNGCDKLENKKDKINYVEGVTFDADGKHLGPIGKGMMGELKHMEYSESNNIIVKHVELAEESCNGHGNSFQESAPVAYVVKLVDSVSEVVNQAVENPLSEEVYNGVVEKIPDVHSSKPVVSVLEEVVQVTHSASLEISVVSNILEHELKKNEEKLISKLVGNTGAPLATLGTESNKIIDLPLSRVVDAGKPLVSTSATISNGTKTIKDSEFCKYLENQPLAILGTESNKIIDPPLSRVNDAGKPLVFTSATISICTKTIKDSEFRECLENQPLVGAPLAMLGIESNKIVDLPLSRVDDAGKSLVSTNATISNGTKTIKDYEFCECLENQPLVGAPLVILGAEWNKIVDPPLSRIDDAGKSLVSTSATISNGTKTIKDSEFRECLKNQLLVGVPLTILGTESNIIVEPPLSRVDDAGKPLVSTSATISNGTKTIKDSEFRECLENQSLVGDPLAILGTELNKIVDSPSSRFDDAGKPLVSTSATISNGTKAIKDSEFLECLENQPLVVSAPRAVRKTSWMSCCGLFEVLRG